MFQSYTYFYDNIYKEYWKSILKTPDHLLLGLVGSAVAERV